MSGLYIHIPFCKQACSYCDFYFVTQQKYKQQFVEKLIEEIESYRETRYSSAPVRTIYFGGGTPSLLLPKQVEAILESVYHTFEVKAEEITLEMNPDDVSRQYLRGLKSAGITRASMGIQSFDPELLKFMHRTHTADEALQCLEILRSSSFQVFTADLIYGNPGQSLEALEKDIETLLSFDPPHVSAYSLTVEPNTRLGKQVELGRILPPEDDRVADHFDLMVARLSDYGIEQYEVSNYAKPGSEAIHNSRYWNHENYLGFGPGAHSFWWSRDRRSAQRWSNKADLRSYLADEPIKEDQETFHLKKLAEERLMLGLRTREGIRFSELKDRYDFELTPEQQVYLERKMQEGKVILDDSIRLTSEGLKITDSILLDLLTS